MGQVSDRTTAEIVERMRSKLGEIFESANDRIHGSDVLEVPATIRSTVSYFRYLIHIRRKLSAVADELHDADASIHEELLRQAEISYLTHPGRFAKLEGRGELLEAWTSLLVEAGAKLPADKERAAHFAEVAADGENLAPSAVSVASRNALRRWHQE